MPNDPLREWQERYSRSGTRLGFKPETDAPFYSSVESICNSPRIVRSTLSPGLLFRDRKMVRDGDDNVSLVVSLSRALSISHRKREACLARNEAIWRASSQALAAVRDFDPPTSGSGLVSRVTPVQTAMRNCTRDEGRSFLRQDKSRKGERECDLKPFVAIQRVQLPPGKG